MRSNFKPFRALALAKTAWGSMKRLNLRTMVAALAATILAALPLTPAAAMTTTSGEVLSWISYEDYFDGEVLIEVQHPTNATCIKAFANDIGFPCEFPVMVRASADYLYVDLYVFDEYGESIGSVRVGDEDYGITTEWQEANMYISEPYDSVSSAKYTIGLDWYEDVVASSVTPVTVKWSNFPKLKTVGSSKLSLKNTKVFSNGTTASLNANYKAPKNGCASVDVKYKISKKAISGWYSHAIVIEDSKGNVAGSVILRTEENGYSGTAKIPLCSYKWWVDDETPRIAVKPGKYKIYILEWDDYFVKIGSTAKKTITFKK